MKNKGQFTKKNAAAMGKKGGRKLKRKMGTEYFSELGKKGAIKRYSK